MTADERPAAAGASRTDADVLRAARAAGVSAAAAVPLVAAPVVLTAVPRLMALLPGGGVEVSGLPLAWRLGVGVLASTCAACWAARVIPAPVELARPRRRPAEEAR